MKQYKMSVDRNNSHTKHAHEYGFVPQNDQVT